MCIIWNNNRIHIVHDWISTSSSMLHPTPCMNWFFVPTFIQIAPYILKRLFSKISCNNPSPLEKRRSQREFPKNMFYSQVKNVFILFYDIINGRDLRVTSLRHFVLFCFFLQINMKLFNFYKKVGWYVDGKI